MTPIEIGRLQRYAVDYVRGRNISLFRPAAPNGKRVGCIGAGPASLACAAELAKWGYGVTIFDRNDPSRRAEYVRHCGVQVSCGRLASRN